MGRWVVGQPGGCLGGATLVTNHNGARGGRGGVVEKEGSVNSNLTGNQRTFFRECLMQQEVCQ